MAFIGLPTYQVNVKAPVANKVFVIPEQIAGGFTITVGDTKVFTFTVVVPVQPAVLPFTV